MPARLRVAVLLVSLLLAGACSHANSDAIVSHLSSSDAKRATLVSVNVLTTTTGPLVVGEVKNVSSGPIDGVQVTVALSDKSGGAVGSQAGPTLLSVIPAGAKASFSIPFTATKAAVHTVSATVEPDPAYVSLNRVPLTVATKATQILGTDYEVSGTVVNSSQVPVSFVNVVATFYDTSGNVVGAANDVSGDATVGPGVTSTFGIILLEQAHSVAKYALAAEGQGVTPGS